MSADTIDRTEPAADAGEVLMFGGEHPGTREAEQATLGACLQNPGVFVEVSTILDETDWAFPAHRLVWETMHRVQREGRPADAMNVSRQILDDQTVGKLPGGSVTYLQTLLAVPPTAANGTWYARHVKRDALNRAIKAVAAGADQQATAGVDPDATIARTQTALSGLLARSATDSCVQWGTLADGAFEWLERAGEAPDEVPGLPTGIPDLDRLLNGFKPGLHVVGALSGVGKSVFMGDVYRKWMSLRVPSCMITLEMSAAEVWRRQAAAACRIDHDKLQRGDLTDGDWSRLARWVGETADAPSWICDKPRMSLAEIAALITRGVQQHGWRGVFVDYAQIIRHHHPAGREREVADIASTLKELSRSLDLVVILGAQLSKDAERRGGAPPRSSDLRESQALKHEADTVILLHRPDKDDRECPRAGEVDLIVDKQRGGKEGVVTCAAQLHYQRFVPFEPDPQGVAA